MSAPAVSVPPREAINAGAAAIDYWLCENDQCIELSSQIRDMFAEGLTAALPAIEQQIRAAVVADILADITRIETTSQPGHSRTIAIQARKAMARIAQGKRRANGGQ